MLSAFLFTMVLEVLSKEIKSGYPEELLYMPMFGIGYWVKRQQKADYALHVFVSVMPYESETCLIKRNMWSN